jgi:hypothetical protein
MNQNQERSDFRQDKAPRRSAEAWQRHVAQAIDAGNAGLAEIWTFLRQQHF